MSAGKQVKVQLRRDHLHDKVSGLTQERLQSVVSQHEIVLPDAEELAKYQALDPNIVSWLMEHAAKEQEFRHESYYRKLVVREKNAASDRRLGGWGMASGFIIFMSGLLLSAFMIYTGHYIAGPIFATSTLVLGASIFVNRTNSAASTTSTKEILESNG